MAVAIAEVIEHFGQLAGSGVGIERQDAVDDVVRPGLVGGVEVARFGRRLEGTHDHSSRIRAQIKILPVQNRLEQKQRGYKLRFDAMKFKEIQARKARSGAGFL